MLTRSLLALTLAGALAACERDERPPERITVGTWGGENAGLIVGEAEAHLHIGCTKGEIPGVIMLDGEGRFDVAGRHNVDAYPVDRGIFHPARYRGRATSSEMTLTVQLTDTGHVLGPATLFFGREPQLGPCPICRR